MCVCQVPKGDTYQDLPITLRVRGSSSAKQYAKKSFKMETQPLNGTDGPANIAFMGAWMAEGVVYLIQGGRR